MDECMLCDVQFVVPSEEILHPETRAIIVAKGVVYSRDEVKALMGEFGFDYVVGQAF